MENEEKKFKIIYEEAAKYLDDIKPPEISNGDFKKYFCPVKNFKTKNDILEHLLVSLQNYQSLPNVIGFGKNKDKFKKILFDFNSDKILKTYPTYELLLDKFVNEFKIDKTGLQRKNNSWVKYSKATISACKFMEEFKDTNDFDHFVNLFSYNASTAAALPMLLSKEIYGLGFALGCDFLKELGYTQYPKPDVHLIEIFSELGLSDKDELDCYKAIARMAKYTKETAYKVDKTFWLISSGNYYMDTVTTKRSKQDFIEYMKSKGY